MVTILHSPKYQEWPSNDKVFTVDARALINNSLCYNQGNFNQENNRAPFHVLLVCFSVGGFGDIIFGIKFARYILNTFPTTHITFLTGDNSNLILKAQKSALDFVEKALLSDYTNRVRVVASRLLRYGNLAVRVIECHHVFRIMYVVPAVSRAQILLTGNYSAASYLNLHSNSYNFTEYNAPAAQFGAAQTGVPYNGEGQLGILLSTDDELLPTPPLLDAVINRRPFSLAYFYTDKRNVDNLAGTNPLLELSLCFLEYFTLIRKESVNYISLSPNQNPSGIAILCKHRMINNLADFIETDPSAGKIDELQALGKVLRDKVYKEDGKMLIEMINYCAMDSKDMFALYQRSIPLVFISGDQSVTDFISTNQYPNQDIFYQIMAWKKELAAALGMSQIPSACGKIPAHILVALKNNPHADFRLRGLRLVENTLLFALNGSPGACQPYLSSDQLGTETYERLVTELKSHKLQFLYKIQQINNQAVNLTQTNPMVSDFKPQQINLGEQEEWLKILSIGSQSGMYIDWLRGSKSSSKGSIYVSIFPYLLNGDRQPAFYGIPVGESDKSGCKNILAKVWWKAEPDTSMSCIVTRAVAAIGMAHIVNNIFRSSSPLQYHLTYTYASLDTRCFPDSSLMPGMLLFSERAPTSMSFRSFLQNPEICDIGALSSVLLQLFWIIYKLQHIGGVVHNALNVDSNILVESLGSPRSITLDELPHSDGDIWSKNIERHQGSNILKLPVKFLVRIQGFSNSRFNYDKISYISIGATKNIHGRTQNNSFSSSPTSNITAREHDKNVLFQEYPMLFQGNVIKYSLPFLLSELAGFCGPFLKEKPKLVRYPCTDFPQLFSEGSVEPVEE
jgi:hypothetical protein